ncbi:MAG: SCO family protein [Ardenticatenales bacterium]
MGEVPTVAMGEWTVEDVLDRCPACASTFVRLQTACIGCVLARFCTVADVAASYGIPLASLIAALAADVAANDGAPVATDGSPRQGAMMRATAPRIASPVAPALPPSPLARWRGAVVLGALLGLAVLAAATLRPGLQETMRAMPAAMPTLAPLDAPRDEGWAGSAVRPERPAPNFALTDQHGRPWSIGAERGRVVLLFFGYTRCIDVCPQTMARLARTFADLGDAADDVTVALVTTDPSHDTPAVLAGYVESYDPRFVGLTGTMDAVLTAAQPYGALPNGDAPHGDADHSHGDGDLQGAADRSADPSIHSSRVWLIDAEGQLRVTFMGPFTPADVTHDVSLLLAERR